MAPGGSNVLQLNFADKISVSMELKTWVDRHVIRLLGAICVVILSCKSCEKGICAVQLLAVVV